MPSVPNNMLLSAITKKLLQECTDAGRSTYSCTQIESIRAIPTAGEQIGYVAYVEQDFHSHDLYERRGPYFVLPLTAGEKKILFLSPPKNSVDPRLGDIMRVMFENIATVSAK